MKGTLNYERRLNSEKQASGRKSHTLVHQYIENGLCKFYRHL